MKNNSIYNELIELAAKAAGIKKSEIRSSQAEQNEGLYHITLGTEFQRHECIADPALMEIFGIISEPSGAYLFDIYRHFGA